MKRFCAENSDTTRKGKVALLCGIGMWRLPQVLPSAKAAQVSVLSLQRLSNITDRMWSGARRQALFIEFILPSFFLVYVAPNRYLIF